MEAPNTTSDYNSEMAGFATQTQTRTQSNIKQKMESAQMAEEALNLLDSSLSQIKWRLKPSSKRRLQIDVLALCTAMRPVVMVDYGGKLPELQDKLCALLELTQKESTIFCRLRVMVIDDMIYIVNVDEFAEYISWSLSSDVKQFFVDLEQEPLKMISTGDESSTVKELASVQKLFSSVFTVEGVNCAALKGQGEDNGQNIESSSAEHPQFSKVVDLSSCLHNSQITIPTINGHVHLHNSNIDVREDVAGLIEIQGGFLGIQLSTYLTRTIFRMLFIICQLSLFTSSEFLCADYKSEAKKKSTQIPAARSTEQGAKGVPLAQTDHNFRKAEKGKRNTYFNNVNRGRRKNRGRERSEERGRSKQQQTPTNKKKNQEQGKKDA